MSAKVILTFDRDYAISLLAKLSAAKGYATDITEIKPPVHGPGDVIHCFSMLLDAVREIEPHLREAVFDVRTSKNAVPFEAVAKLEKENAALKAALKEARALALRPSCGFTMRQFAAEIGITPTQLSEWTSDKPTTAPDFVN